MNEGSKPEPSGAKLFDFFISYTGKDKAWAEWIAWVLEEAGYRTFLQAWDFPGGSNFILKMQHGATEATRTIAVISPDYFKAEFTHPEWASALAQDPKSEKGKLIAVRVADFDPPGMFKTIVYIDLVGLKAEPAQKRLIERITDILKGTRRKPNKMPVFPGGQPPAAPPFPGNPAATNTPLHNLPFPPNPLFTGREDLLTNLHTGLTKKTIAAITQPQAVHGLGGVGKTQLAVEYAWRHQKDYDALLWAGADSPAQLHANLARLAALLKLPEAEAPQQEIQLQAVLNWLQTNSRWLLILDNADTREAAEAVQNLLPPGLCGHVVVTSRRTEWPPRFDHQEVRLLPLPVAADFLQQRVAKSGFHAGDPKDAEAVATELGCLPLALEQAGAYVARHRITFKDYLGLLKASRKKLLAVSSVGGTNYQQTVATTWWVSEQQLSPAARAILQMTAFLAPDEIPRDLFLKNSEVIAEAAALTGKDQLTAPEPSAQPDIADALAELRDHSLLELESDACTCHRLLQAVLLDRLPPDARKKWGQLTVKLANTYAPYDSDDVRTWPVWDRLRPHATRLLVNIGEDADIDAAQLMNQLWLLLKTKALFVEAEPLMRRALAIDEKSFGPDHPTVAIRLNNLAQLLKATNRLAEAEPLMRRTLAIDEKNFGPDHPDVARDLNNLAQLLKATNRLAEAEPLMRRALTIDEKNFGPDHPNVARDLNNLATLLKATNRLAEAEPLSRRAAGIMVRSLGLDHPRTKIALGVYQAILSAMKLSEPEIESRLQSLPSQ